MSNLTHPPQVGRYQILEPIGFGGMGSVYRALDPNLQRHVAVKVLVSRDAEAQKRFMLEARLVARLGHPNIVSVFDVGVEGGVPYIVQELLDGVDLRTVLHSEVHLSLGDALHVFLSVAQALQHAHQQGIIHRDIKPSNIILLWSREVKVVDFGIAKFGLSDAEMTRPGSFLGTLGYSSPEQLQGAQVDLRSDIFSFGAVAYETLAGAKAFGGEDFSALAKILTVQPEPLDSVRLGIPGPLADLVWRCLAKDRDHRFASMDEIVALLSMLHAEAIPLTASTWPVPKDVARSSSLPTSSYRTDHPTESNRAGLTEETLRRPPVPHSPSRLESAVEGTMAGPIVEVTLSPTRVWPEAQTLAPETALRPSHQVARPEGPHKETPDALSRIEPLRQIPERAGRFTLHELVAEGRTGALYKAFDPVRGRLVGVKVIFDRTGLAVRRLLRASQIWLDLHHENLQKILEIDPGEGSRPALIVTELVEGADLQRVVAQRRLTLEEKLSVAIQTCDASQYMHDHGVIHREIKPRNIVLSVPGLKVTLLDSGLARSPNPEVDELTRTGIAVGDLRYAAPEQQHGRFDQCSDVYSVGAVLYELVLGERPPLGDPAGMRRRVEEATGFPPKLCAALVTALHEDPERRFASMKEFADNLRDLLPQKPRPVALSSIVVTLHGIRTHARWQRAFSEVASAFGLQCRLDRWNFGHFSVGRFLIPWPRRAKFAWLRRTYSDEFDQHVHSPLSDERPSIIAHSFGTYILGNALLRYPYIRFNKVLLCGSILPTEFPWDALIERGQVQAVRNEFGSRDLPTRVVQWFVHGTGPSGIVGFKCRHRRLEQEVFDFSHSEYFEKSHMEHRWLPFLRRKLGHITPVERDVQFPPSSHPLGLYLAYALLTTTFVLLVVY